MWISNFDNYDFKRLQYESYIYILDKIILFNVTARVRSMTGGYVFTGVRSIHRGGGGVPLFLVPSPLGVGVPQSLGEGVPRDRIGGIPQRGQEDLLVILAQMFSLIVFYHRTYF